MKLSRRISKIFSPELQRGYSQFGEDLILSHFFSQRGIEKPSYLDIGANEPRYISNTYFFYQRGCSGVLVEPNPFLCKKLRSLRRRDTVLNIGIGITAIAEADFYVFPNYANGLSTFSEKDARHWEVTGMKGLGKIPVEKIIKMPLIPVNEILDKYFNSAPPDFVSLDVEGLDFDIMQSFDFEMHQPKAFCIETLAYDEHQKGYKLNKITDFMEGKNYAVYADTRVNTIFCPKDLL